MTDEVSSKDGGSEPDGLHLWSDSNRQAFLASIVESSQDAIIGKALDGTILSWNRGAERIFGYAPEEVLGRSITVLAVPGQVDDILHVLARVGRGERIEHYETSRATKDGRIINVSLTVSPIRDVSGVIVGASKIARDISDRKRTEQQNLALLEEVRRGVKGRDEFLSMLAHELRNPLAPLRNSIHLLRLRSDDPTVVERVRDMMDRQVTHMSRLINDLLDVSRITRGKITLNRERTDLGQLTRLVVDDHLEPFREAGVALNTSIPEVPIWVGGDRTRLTQVLDNLLENACKFTDPGGEVSVEVAADGPRREAVVRVRDTGIGVEPELLPRIFDVFTQADLSLDRPRGGLGLGLALVRRLVELHGGTVRAGSEGRGRGAEFLVLLPLEDEPMALTETPAGEAAPSRHVRILVVEDNRDSAESLRMLLATHGYDVRLAFNGVEGVQSAQQSHPDVIICDVGLPGMDGFAVARAIREHPDLRHVRLIAVTGYGREDDRKRALDSGFDSHLVKPADPEALLALIV
ncbi:Autoinducer 2 sensor kinase/phosphatase LuxQ [Aquisphaera giovannonii]|uniref:histidine kinase n=1 Tax=Aquisphaera giovannonii TaxID=406548 RepID=A0A5B9W0X7_9BACT|nr:PAS domain S-box protein [Aquisphaera giovannonii]QEH33874.1 Autoinducer 2 sensor kinase/phosphatase LuxQ [Aquisphaera giovannonii]